MTVILVILLAWWGGGNTTRDLVILVVLVIFLFEALVGRGVILVILVIEEHLRLPRSPHPRRPPSSSVGTPGMRIGLGFRG